MLLDQQDGIIGEGGKNRKVTLIFQTKSQFTYTTAVPIGTIKLE